MSLLPYHKGNKTKFTNLLFLLILFKPVVRQPFAYRDVIQLETCVGKSDRQDEASC